MNRDFVLLGIKYESAVMAGLDPTRLSAIEEQIEKEVGADWKGDPSVLHGRNAAREERGLDRL